MLSLLELRRVARVLDAELAGARVERWVQPEGGDRLALRLYGRRPGDESGHKRVLLFCAHPDFARVSEPERLPKAPASPPAFCAYLRAHLARATLRRVSVRGEDRQLALQLEAREGRFVLLLSLFGRRSNVYLLDPEGRLVAHLRPLRETREELALGEPWRDPGSRPPHEGRDRFEDVPDDELLRAVEARYAESEGERAGAELGRGLATALRKEVKNARRRLERVEAELAEADQASVLQRHGELLKGSLDRISTGDTEVRLTDYETGEPVVVPLDPKKTPAENLEATFKRYQKLVRRLAKAGGQVDEARERLERLEALLARAETLRERDDADPDALDALAAEPEVAALVGRQQASRARASAKPAPGPELPAMLRKLPTRLVPRRYRSRDGLEIWVGRSDECNDHLTTRLARGRDLFFHLDGAPGSHVVLRTEGDPDPPHESLLDACELAVHFSKAKNASHAEVHVAPIKQVKKPRGAKPGLVWVTGGRSIRLRREEERLERLMQSRL